MLVQVVTYGVIGITAGHNEHNMDLMSIQRLDRGSTESSRHLLRLGNGSSDIPAGLRVEDRPKMQSIQGEHYKFAKKT